MIEVLPGDFGGGFAGTGFRLMEDSRISVSELEAIAGAVELLAVCPELLGSVRRLVSTVHLGLAAERDVDISFSYPELPFSIFTSIPLERSTARYLRLAEAVLHEAMHLQLSMIEEQVPLFAGRGRLYRSPWREELGSPARRHFCSDIRIPRATASRLCSRFAERRTTAASREPSIPC